MPRDWGPLATYLAITAILALLGWTWLARTVRSKLLATRTEDFVLAARLSGCSDARIIRRHLLPSFMSYLIVDTSIAFPEILLAETSLSFLGLGLREPVESWGVLLFAAQTHPRHRPGALADDPRRLRHRRGARLQLRRRRPARRRRPLLEDRDGASPRRPTLEVRDLSIAVDVSGERVALTEDVSFSIGRGEVLALVGESGSGKSVTALSLMQLLGANLSIAEGEILLHARDGFSRRHREARPGGQGDRAMRGGHMGMIFQEPMSSFSPVHTIGAADRRGRRGARARRPQGEARARAADAARQGRHPRSDRRARPLSVGVLRRHAPARDDRAGAGLRASRC